MNTPKYYVVINNPTESHRERPLDAQDEDAAMQEAEKFIPHLLRGGAVHVIENGVREVGLVNQAGKVTRFDQ